MASSGVAGEGWEGASREFPRLLFAIRTFGGRAGGTEGSSGVGRQAFEDGKGRRENVWRRGMVMHTLDVPHDVVPCAHIGRHVHTHKRSFTCTS